MPKSKPHVFKHVFIRHYCSVCSGQVVPSSKFETETIAPVQGVKKANILLRSYNASHKADRRAWCFSCKGWQPADRLTEADILRKYLFRDGVAFRSKTHLRELVAARRDNAKAS